MNHYLHPMGERGRVFLRRELPGDQKGQRQEPRRQTSRNDPVEFEPLQAPENRNHESLHPPRSFSDQGRQTTEAMSSFTGRSCRLVKF